MNELKIFNNTEFGELDIMLIDGKEYFPATQCAKVLGYAKPADAIRNHCKGVFKIETPTKGGVQQVNYIPEGDLYRLIISSKLPSAEKFERWVFDEVIPSIRKSGGYGNTDISGIIAQTVSATVQEVMKQLIPVIAGTISGTSAVGNVRKKARKYTGHIQHSKIDMLPPALKKQADKMLASGEYSCRQVAEYIVEKNGGYISTQSVVRYKNKNFDVEDDDESQISLF